MKVRGESRVYLQMPKVLAVAPSQALGDWWGQQGLLEMVTVDLSRNTVQLQG